MGGVTLYTAEDADFAINKMLHDKNNAASKYISKINNDLNMYL